MLTSRRNLLKLCLTTTGLQATNVAMGAKTYGAGMANPAWTYSQLDTFETCPKKFYHLKVIRDTVDPPTVYTEWGSKVHTAFENFILHGELLPDGMTQWQPLADKLAALKGAKFPERQYAVDKNFQPCDWDNAWTRGIADLVVIQGSSAAVLDYKTGKRKPTEQLDLYATYVFHHHPEVQKVTTGFVWLKEKKIDWQVRERDDLATIWQNLLPRVHKLESAYERGSWPAKTSGLCKAWCPVTSCKFNGRRT